MWKIARIQGPKFFFFFVQIAVVIVIILFNPCGIFEKMTSFTPVFNQELEQGKFMAALNSRK